MRPTGADSFRQDLVLPQTDIVLNPKQRRGVEDTKKTNGSPVTFFLKSEEELAAGPSQRAESQDDRTVGVQSLNEAIEEGCPEGEQSGTVEDGRDQDESTVFESRRQDALAPSTIPSEPPSARNSSPTRSPIRELTRPSSTKTLSLPLTPVLNQSPTRESVQLSTPRSVSLRSLRLSDDEHEGSSQAIASSGDEDEEGDKSNRLHLRRTVLAEAGSDGEVQGSTLQLVMPSIRMPSRRPFTDKGKYMGKLKVLVTGGPRSGKTSLIRAIVQTCEDIVHVDPPVSSGLTSSSLQRPQYGVSSSENASRRPSSLEMHASTRPYPSWWSDMDESRGSRRNSSATEAILERNVTFIEAVATHNSKGHHTALSYLQRSMERNLSFATLSDNEIIQVLSGDGGLQVDLVIFVIDATSSSVDLSAIKKLFRYSVVLPVIGRVDTILKDDLVFLKQEVQGTLQEITLENSSLHQNTTGLEALLRYEHIPAITSLPASDDDNMDASLLMSSEYIQPLTASDLQQFVLDVFNPDASAQLRHYSAKKFINWRRTRLSQTQASSPIIALPTFHHASISSGLPSSASTAPAGNISSATFTLARMNDHTRYEERAAQVHLARWASGLQKALHNERIRYALLQDAERTAWLQARLDERVDISSKDDSSSDGAFMIKRDVGLTRIPSWSRASLVDPRDPLGLLAWNHSILDNSLTVVKVVGGASVVGALVVWIARAWGLENMSECEVPFGKVLWPWNR